MTRCPLPLRIVGGLRQEGSMDWAPLNCGCLIDEQLSLAFVEMGWQTMAVVQDLSKRSLGRDSELSPSSIVQSKKQQGTSSIISSHLVFARRAWVTNKKQCKSWSQKCIFFTLAMSAAMLGLTFLVCGVSKALSNLRMAFVVFLICNLHSPIYSGIPCGFRLDSGWIPEFWVDFGWIPGEFLNFTYKSIFPQCFISTKSQDSTYLFTCLFQILVVAVVVMV